MIFKEHLLKMLIMKQQNSKFLKQVNKEENKLFKKDKRIKMLKYVNKYRNVLCK